MPKLHQLFLILGLFFACCSCSKKPADTILGKWHTQGDPPENVTEFKPDGTFLASEVTHAGTPDHAVLFTNIVSGNYWFLPQNQMKIQIIQHGAVSVSMTNNFSIAGDEITMTSQNPNHLETFHLHRIK